MDPKSIKIGMLVWWDDPDEGLASGIGTVVSLNSNPPEEDTVIGLDMRDGGFAEVFAHELKEA